MLFNSYFFIFVFFPVTFFLYFFLSSKKLTFAAKIWLAGASLIFYGWWNIAFFPLILISIAFNYGIGVSVGRNQKVPADLRKFLLVFGIVLNLLLLGYFKYYMFFASNVNLLLQMPIFYFIHARLVIFNIILPLGISFFTFTQIAYLADSYRGAAKEYSLLNYILFVTFFPHLIAGPIIHHKEMMPQFDSLRNKILSHENIRAGLLLFSIGLFKKLILADTFAVWANYGFNKIVDLTTVEAWLVSFSYTFQLYFDFSGYTDMAVGAALFFNIKLPINFNSPYQALSIQDFWRRWHMTLSRFFMDYLYIPMGGNKVGDIRMYCNLMATFLIGGIWHGAGWLFLIWGFLHGVASVIYRGWTRFNFKLHFLAAWAITFGFVNFTWIFFRSKDLSVVKNILGSMMRFSGGQIDDRKSLFSIPYGRHFLHWNHLGSPINHRTAMFVVFGFIIALGFTNSNKIVARLNHHLGWAVLTGLLFAVSMLFMVRNSPFLYFQF